MSSPPGAPLEIERVFLLSRMPDLPPGADVVKIEQGYLPDGGTGETGALEGRVRRMTRPGNDVRCFHTVKKGLGLVRTEEEREIPVLEFERLWPSTVGRRISKTRHKVKVGDLTWEIDRFDGLDLVLAEVELPTEDTAAPMPEWLRPCVVREVTEEAEYRNFSIAKRLGRV